MTASTDTPTQRRKLIRRRADRQMQEQLDKYMQLFKVAQSITSELDFDTLFRVIIEQISRIMAAERCSIFLIDEKREQLRAFVSVDLKRNEFRIPRDQGIAGWVFCNRKPLIINDAYADPRFCSAADRQTGFCTRNILCAPLIDRNRNCIGTMQVLNKTTGRFSGEDREFFSYVASFVTVALENSRLYEELKASAVAREKAINHLSHELKTPLSIISVVFDRIAHVVQDYDMVRLNKTIARGKRNLTRLLELQEKVDDIINRKAFEVERQYRHTLESIGSLIEELGERAPEQYADIVRHVTDRINEIFQVKQVALEAIDLKGFLDELCAETLARAVARKIRLKTDFEDGLWIKMDRKVLKKVGEGLLKNAIENTPDKGTIEISASAGTDAATVAVTDHGVGITAANQQNIFKGFFHTQDTMLYSSKKPYQFNAGGAGTDLLRIRTFAERFGFSIDFESTRCPYIPSDENICPGDVALCKNIAQSSDCRAAGGSRFILRFPILKSHPRGDQDPGSV
jgi:signal transduction histidine kinase